MKQHRNYCLIILLFIFIQSCIPSSIDQTKMLDTPDYTKVKDFGIEKTGKIVYQFYQKYGFNDSEQQLILITKPNKVNFLTMELPIDTGTIKRFEIIDARKFIKDKPINFSPEKTIHADIRIESVEYDSGLDKSVFCNKGKYIVSKTDIKEIIYVFDINSGLMYIESKKRM